MSVPERPISPIASSIEVLRRQFGLGALDTMAVIEREWRVLAGEQVADRSTVIDLRGGTLTVDAHDPATAEVLRWGRQRILDGVRDRCPGERIVDLTVRVRRRSDAPSATGRPPR